MNSKLYTPIKTIAQTKKRVMVFFSTGKDSIVTLDLIHKFVRNYDILYLYYYKSLSYRKKVLDWYEKRYQKKIIWLPHPERIWSFKRMGKDVNTKVVVNDIEEYVRKNYNVDYFAYGHRLAENLTRRAMLSKFKNGINEKIGRVYPVLYFKKSHILQYIESNNLLLPIEYKYGFYNIDMFKGDSLLWLYNNFRNDYEAIKKEFPFIEEDLRKIQWERQIISS